MCDGKYVYRKEQNKYESKCRLSCYVWPDNVYTFPRDVFINIVGQYNYYYQCNTANRPGRTSY